MSHTLSYVALSLLLSGAAVDVSIGHELPQTPATPASPAQPATPPQPSTPPQPPSPPAPAAPGAATSAQGTMGPPRLPPFAGAVVNYDRRGDRIVACVDRSTQPARTGAPLPPGPSLPPAYRIWLIEREVMQELMATGGLCDPVWSPDGKTFLAAGTRGLFALTEPQFEARVLVLTPTTPKPGAAAPGAAPSAPTAGPSPITAPDATPIPFSQLSWSPSGRRVAFLLTTNGATSVRVVDAKDGAALLTREQPAKLVQWGPDDRTLVVDGARVAVP